MAAKKTSTTPCKWWEKHSKANQRLVPVFILNIDLAGSSKLEAEHPVRMKAIGNTFQDEVSTTLRNSEFHLGEWSGDGLVALQEGVSADRFVETALALFQRLAQIKAAEISKSPSDAIAGLELRAALIVGNVLLDEKVGRIISPAMNIAGHFQKHCPAGHLLLNKEAWTLIEDKKLKDQFVQDTMVPHGDEKLPAFTHQHYVVTTPESYAELEDKVIATLWNNGAKIIVRTPSACYVAGEFANIFGYPAIIMPIPLFLYVGAAPIDNEAIEIVKCFGPEPGVNYVPHGEELVLQLPEEKWTQNVQGKARDIWTSIRLWMLDRGIRSKGIRIWVWSFCPPGCGLNASSALSAAIAAAAYGLYDDRNGDLLSSIENAVTASDFLDPREDPCFWSCYKLAWAIDNCFHANAASGCGVLAALYGSSNRLPLVYLAEKRGLERGFPFDFGHDAESVWKNHEFQRLHGGAWRMPAPPNYQPSRGLDFALLHAKERSNNSGTGDMINTFLKTFLSLSDNTKKFLRQLVHSSPGTFGMHREPLLHLADRIVASKGDNVGFKLADNSRDPCRDALVEWLVQSLGCTSVLTEVCMLEFMAKGDAAAKDERFVQRFLGYINAYQELLSSAGVSIGTLDLLNHRSDLLAFEVSNPDHPSCAFGTKLTGGGGGGDLLVIGPMGEVRRQFPYLRRALGVRSRQQACHYVSWEGKQQLPAPVPKVWYLPKV